MKLIFAIMGSYVDRDDVYHGSWTGGGIDR